MPRAAEKVQRMSRACSGVTPLRRSMIGAGRLRARGKLALPRRQMSEAPVRPPLVVETALCKPGQRAPPRKSGRLDRNWWLKRDQHSRIGATWTEARLSGVIRAGAGRRRLIAPATGSSGLAVANRRPSWNSRGHGPASPGCAGDDGGWIRSGGAPSCSARSGRDRSKILIWAGHGDWWVVHPRASRAAPSCGRRCGMA